MGFMLGMATSSESNETTGFMAGLFDDSKNASGRAICSGNQERGSDEFDHSFLEPTRVVDVGD
jgi:hypothetical protein